MSRARRPNRRYFLTSLAAAGTVALARPGAARGAARSPWPAPPPAATGLPPTRALDFRHLHTGERLSVDYAVAGRYDVEALAAVNHLLRDFRTGDVHAIDPRLLDLLHALAGSIEASAPFDVISGYRSPATNAALRRRSEGVAAHSLHMVGQAIDIRLADVPLTRLRAAAVDLGRGGVGYYPASNFVHVDTGRVRRW
jgi:uncharacterized protein YcbK (DUF882 family)